ncbi:ABC transporter substrate-binding protein [Vibrio sp. ZSDZ34]|uniref:ABC transporter substrate-binding protein n=1 Tax=Vibrio gelatinilyticus TaxID=2893468 RepID=A0A9X1W9P9_9VIBR|nr:ABC transporter substrate-binding protein [Vibrio gelatinilyticus]MCJ2376882.1 ABC transporter substrate-binding protein [Vibrio gelatinilyticus]
MKMKLTVLSLIVSSTTVFADTKPTTQSQVIAEGNLQLTISGYQFPRLEPILTGQVDIEGVDLEFKKMGIGEMNNDVFNGDQTLDITEIGLHPYMLAYANEEFRDYTLLPIYPLRVFRHKSIFINTDAGINNPEDLKGKTIGTPGYASTSLTWIRGMLQDEYGITPQNVNWLASDVDSSKGVTGAVSAQEATTPNGVTIRIGSAGKDESELLVTGEVDALFHAAEPKAYVEGNKKVARLFANSKAAEQAYYEKTGVFPIMHAVAIKTELIEQHPWLAEAVYNAYIEAKDIAYSKMNTFGWAADMLPWYVQELESTRAFMGDNFFTYGLDENNVKTLETLFRYSYEQGLSSRKLSVEELFHPLTLDFVD